MHACICDLRTLLMLEVAVDRAFTDGRNSKGLQATFPTTTTAVDQGMKRSSLNTIPSASPISSDQSQHKTEYAPLAIPRPRLLGRPCPRRLCCVAARRTAGKRGRSTGCSVFLFSTAITPQNEEDEKKSDMPYVRRESLAQVDVPKAVGELEGAAEGEVTFAPPAWRCCRRGFGCGTGRKRSATV